MFLKEVITADAIEFIEAISGESGTGNYEIVDHVEMLLIDDLKDKEVPRVVSELWACIRKPDGSRAFSSVDVVAKFPVGLIEPLTAALIELIGEQKKRFTLRKIKPE